MLHGLLWHYGTALLPKTVNNGQVLTFLEALTFDFLAVLLRLLNIVVSKGGLARLTAVTDGVRLRVIAIFSRGVFGFKKDFFVIKTFDACREIVGILHLKVVWNFFRSRLALLLLVKFFILTRTYL